ncbi:MAG: acetoin utilization protein AcuB [Planctomycetota bacterium]|jgi:acetoin utilization protein AcuB
MLIRFHMSRDLVTFPARTPCSEALASMRLHGIRRAPVMHDGKLSGIVTERDLLRVLPGGVTQYSPDPPVAQIQSRTPISVHPNDSIEFAAQLMLNKRIGGLLVIDDERLVGIITESDLFRVLIGFNARSGGERLLLRSPIDAEDQLLRICIACGARVLAMIRMPYEDGLEHISLCVQCERIDELSQRLSSTGYMLLKSSRPA